MTWVVSRIIGDGVSPATAYRTAAQQYGVAVLNADHIPVDPKTGKPISNFALLQIPDGQESKIKADAGCYVIPDMASIDALAKADMDTKLQAQACLANVVLTSNTTEVLAAIRQRMSDDATQQGIVIAVTGGVAP